MPHHRICILIIKRLYFVAGLCLIVFSTPATAVFESFLSEITEPLTIRCETGVRFTDEHGSEDAIRSKLTDETKAKLYFHDVFQKDVYLFFIPETNVENVRHLGYLNDDHHSEPIFGPLVLKDAFYIKNSSPKRHKVVVVAKTSEAIVLFGIEEERKRAIVKAFTIDRSKFTVQVSDWRPYIDMGYCEQSVLAD